MSTLYRYGIWFAKGVREYTKSGYMAACKSFESLDEHRVDGRSFLITGANSGIGKEAALAVAKKGGTVYMVCRSEERGKEAQQDIITKSENSNVHLYILDMSQPKKIYEFVKQLKTDKKSVHAIVNNAGCMVNQRTLTSDNLEMNFATNTLGTYILTTELIDYMKQFDKPQVITVTSGGMLLVKLDNTDMQFEKMNPFDGTMAYSQNKRQQVVLTDYWAKNYPEIQFTTMHPGWADTPAVRNSMPDFHRRMGNRLRTPEEGADTLVWLLLSPTARNAESGGFFQDRQPVNKHLPLAWTKNSEADTITLVQELAKIASSLKP